MTKKTELVNLIQEVKSSLDEISDSLDLLNQRQLTQRYQALVKVYDLLNPFIAKYEITKNAVTAEDGSAR